MKTLFVIFLMMISVISGTFLAPRIIPYGHATGLTGKVCLAPTTATVCPATAPTIPGPGPGSNKFFLINVILNSSDPLSSFDITLLSDHTTLNPTAVKFGTINLGSTVTELIKCIGGVNKIGSSACPSTDNINTIHYAVSGAITGGTGTTTGVLLTANYTVITNVANTPITFQTGCTATPTSVPGGICVTISPGGTTPDSETVQTAKFTNQPYFDLLPSAGTLQVSEGNVDSSLSLSMTSLNGFGGTTGQNVSLSGSSSQTGITLTVSPNKVLITTGFSGLVAGITVNVTKTVPPQNYTLTITGTSGTLAPNSVDILLNVPVPDFSITHNPEPLRFNVTVIGKPNITITSIGNYAANVTLTETSSRGLASSFTNSQQQTILKLRAGQTNTTTLFLNSTIPGSYVVNVTATSGSFVHLDKITIFVVDYALSAAPGVLTVVNGTTVPKPIIISASTAYNTTVTIGKIYIDQVTLSGPVGPSNGVAVTCLPKSLQLTNTGNLIGQNTTFCQVTGQAVGNYVVTVTAASGSPGHTSNHALSFQVAVVRPGFSIVLPSTVTTISIGSSTTIKATISNNHGVTDNVTVSVSISPTNMAQFFTLSENGTQSAQKVVFTSVTANATVLVTITASATAPQGQYTLIVEGTGKFSDPPVVDAKLAFAAVFTTSPHNLVAYSVTPSVTSVTVGSDVTITVVVQNLGRLPENATIVAIVGDQTVGTKNVTIAVGANVTETFTWHTAGYNPGAYMVGGKVLGFDTVRSAAPVTLSAANTSILSSPYTIPAIVIAVIILLIAVAILYFIPRRKIQTS